METQKTLIVGANSSIAKAIAKEIKTGLVLISRSLDQADVTYSELNDNNIYITINDYEPESIKQAIALIPRNEKKPITRVFICNGILHTDKIKPEKRMEELDTASFNLVMKANALTPMLWIQQLTPLMRSKSPCKLVVFSARVGSISDNRLGGWYSYRASKAALNMMLKNTAIEFSRRSKNIKVIVFHPGTTDTALSKPFQKNVSPQQLFTSEFVAQQLLTIIETIALDQSASYLDWLGKTISW